MKSKNLQMAMAVMIVLAAFGGCATERHITPTLSEPPRTGLELKPPILGAVLDGRLPKIRRMLRHNCKRI